MQPPFAKLLEKLGEAKMLSKVEKFSYVAEKSKGKVRSYNSIYAEILGSATAGLVLSQLVYWSIKVNHREFYKTDSELRKEIMLGIDEFKAAKKKILKSGILYAEIKGIPAKTFYSLNINYLYDLFLKIDKSTDDLLVENTQFSSWELHHEVGGKSTKQLVENPPTNTKTTQRLRHKTTTKKIQKEIAVVEVVDEQPPATIDLTADSFNFVSELNKNVLIEPGIECSNSYAKRLVERPRSSVENQFDEFWAKYPLRKGKGAALVSFIKAVKKTSLARILTALNGQIAERETAIRLGCWIPPEKHPSTWLNQQCWDDEIKSEDEIRKRAAIEMRSKITYAQAKAEEIKANRSPEMVELERRAKEREKVPTRESLLEIALRGHREKLAKERGDICE
jgi:hypothetical protein